MAAVGWWARLRNGGGGATARAWALSTPLGQHAGRVEAAAELVGDEGGGAPVAVGQGQLQLAPGVPLQPPQALRLGQALQLLQCLDQLPEVGLGQQFGDLPPATASARATTASDSPAERR